LIIISLSLPLVHPLLLFLAYLSLPVNLQVTGFGHDNCTHIGIDYCSHYHRIEQCSYYDLLFHNSWKSYSIYF
jgi:hypothetical protein